MFLVQKGKHFSALHAGWAGPLVGSVGDKYLYFSESKDDVFEYYFGTRESHCTHYIDYIYNWSCASTSNFQKMNESKNCKGW